MSQNPELVLYGKCQKFLGDKLIPGLHPFLFDILTVLT